MIAYGLTSRLESQGYDPGKSNHKALKSRTTKLSDAGTQGLPNHQLMPPARIRSGDFVGHDL
jgi:hypothetical protein